MALIIDNPDWQGIREGFADEEISFWDLPNQDEHFFPADDQSVDAEELRYLIQDFYRCTRQTNELCKINPAKAENYFSQYCETQNHIERRIKRILGNKVRFTENTLGVLSALVVKTPS